MRMRARTSGFFSPFTKENSNTLASSGVNIRSSQRVGVWIIQTSIQKVARFRLGGALEGQYQPQILLVGLWRRARIWSHRIHHEVFSHFDRNGLWTCSRDPASWQQHWVTSYWGVISSHTASSFGCEAIGEPIHSKGHFTKECGKLWNVAGRSTCDFLGIPWLTWIAASGFSMQISVCIL